MSLKGDVSSVSPLLERLEDPLRSLMTHLRQCHLLHNLQLLQKLIHQ